MCAWTGCKRHVSQFVELFEISLYGILTSWFPKCKSFCKPFPNLQNVKWWVRLTCSWSTFSFLYGVQKIKCECKEKTPPTPPPHTLLPQSLCGWVLNSSLFSLWQCSKGVWAGARTLDWWAPSVLPGGPGQGQEKAADALTQRYSENFPRAHCQLWGECSPTNGCPWTVPVCQDQGWVCCPVLHLTLTNPEERAGSTISRWEKRGTELLNNRSR